VPGAGGVAGETFACLETLGGLGLPTWFRLGDRDLAVHIFRTERLRAGWPLSRVTAALARAQGVRATVLPMTDAAVRTVVHTPAGALAFQDYLVRRRGRDRVRRIHIRGAARARPAPGVLAALRQSTAIVIAPSNPLVSIGPMLAVPAIRRTLARRRAPAAVVSPLVGGRAVRGPLDRMLRGLGLEVSPRGIARLYRGLVDVFVLDRRDAAHADAVAALGMRPVVTETIMRTPGTCGAPCRCRPACARSRARMTVAVIPVPGLPMIQPGDDLPRLLGDAIDAARVGLKSGDVVAVCQKVVSKAEGAVVRLDDVVASPFAEHLASRTGGGKDPRAMEVVLREAQRIVRMDRGHVICETRHGFVCANAGVDESNGVEPGMLTLLPKDPDASAERLRAALAARFGVDIAVVVTDTFGRPWREGLVEVALGCAGMDPLLDLRGRADLARPRAASHGRRPRRHRRGRIGPGHGEGQPRRGGDRAWRALRGAGGRTCGAADDSPSGSRPLSLAALPSRLRGTVLASNQVSEGGKESMRTTMKGSIRVGAAAAIFAAGFLVGSITQRPAEAQLGDLKDKAMEGAGEQGGVVGAAGQLGTQLTDMKKNLDGLQKNYDMLKKVQSMLGG
jgi:LPPG:FO 2-phospho-L-lactate transferase